MPPVVSQRHKCYVIDGLITRTVIPVFLIALLGPYRTTFNIFTGIFLRDAPAEIKVSDQPKTNHNKNKNTGYD